MNDNQKYLYESLQQAGIEVGSADEFINGIKTPEGAKWAYDQLSKQVDLGDYDTYYNAIAGGIEDKDKEYIAPALGGKERPIEPAINPQQLVRDRAAAKLMSPEDTNQVLNQGVPGVTQITPEVSINHLQTDMLMQEKFGGEYEDTSTGKTEQVTPVGEMDVEADIAGGPIVTGGREQKERPDSFLSYMGDTANSINTGASHSIAGLLGYGEDFYRQLESLGIPGLENLYGVAKDALGGAKEYFKRDAAASTLKTSNYGGEGFMDLWKQGKYVDSVAKLYLDATQSIPISVASMGAIAAGAPSLSFGLMYASQTGNTLDELKDNTDMSEVQKQVNAHLIGAAEGFTELFGDKVIVGWLGDVLKRGGERVLKGNVNKMVKPVIHNLLKSNSLLIPPAIEGTEEFVNALSQNLINYLTGKTNVYEPMKGTLESFIQGFAGGSQFAAVGALGMAKNQVVDYVDGATARVNFNHSRKEFEKKMAESGYKPQDIQDLETQLMAAAPEQANDMIASITQTLENGVVEGELSIEAAKPLIDFYRDAQQVKARSTRLKKQIEEFNQRAEKYVSDNVNPDMSALVFATQGTDEVRVVSGTIVPLEGNKIDLQKSDETVYIEKDGEIMPVSTTTISNPHITPIEQAVKEVADQAAAPVVAQHENEEVRPYNAGENIRADLNGSPVLGTVIERKDNGNYTIRDAQGVIIDVEPRQIVNEDNLEGVDNESIVEYKDPTGAIRTGVVTDIYSQRPEGFAFIDDQRVPLSDILGLKTDNVIPETPQNEGASPVANSNLSELPPPPANLLNDGNGNITEIPQAGATQEAVQAPYPVTTKGELDFDNFTPEQLFSYTAEQYGEEAAIEDVKVSIAGLEAQLSKKKKAFEKMGMKERVKARAEISKIEAEIASFKNLIPTAPVESAPAEVAKTAAPVESALPTQQGKRRQFKPDGVVSEREKRWGEPQSLRELLLRYFILNGRLSWNDKPGTKGLGAEYRYSEQERRSHIQFIKNDGPTPEQLADDIWGANAYEEGHFEDLPLYGISSMDIHNEILDIMNSYTGRSGMIEAVEAMHATSDMDSHAAAIYENEDIADDVENNFEDFINNPEENPFFVDQSKWTPEQKQQANELSSYFAQFDEGNTAGSATVISEEGRSAENNPQSSPQPVNQGQEQSGEGFIPTDNGGISTSNQGAETGESGITDEINSQDPELNPTEAQKEAGNYKKAHIKVQGMDISIENPKGSTRSGVDENGKEWSNTLQNHYGYFTGTTGKDGDQIDTFIGENPETDMVFVVDQNNPETGVFDESKVMLGFNTPEEAKAAYMSNYQADWKGFGSITPVSIEDFKKWLYDGARQRKPFSEYKDTPEPVKPIEGNQAENEADLKPIKEDVKGIEGEKKPLPTTVRELADYDAGEQKGYLSGMFFSGLEKGSKFKVGRKDYEVTQYSKPKKVEFTSKKGESIVYDEITIRIKELVTGKTITSRLITWPNGNSQFTGVESNHNHQQLSRDIEGDVNTDLINEYNRFHEKSDSFKIIQKQLDKLNSQPESAKPEVKTKQTDKAIKPQSPIDNLNAILSGEKVVQTPSLEEQLKAAEEKLSTVKKDRDKKYRRYLDLKEKLDEIGSRDQVDVEGNVSNGMFSFEELDKEAKEKVNAARKEYEPLNEEVRELESKIDKLQGRIKDKAMNQQEMNFDDIPESKSIIDVDSQIQSEKPAPKNENKKTTKLQEEADAALKDFLDAFNDLNSDNLGIVDNTAEKQAKMLVAGTKMIAAYTKLELYKFADIIYQLSQKGIQITDDLLSAIKKAYGAFAAENDIDELDDMKTVRAFKIEEKPAMEVIQELFEGSKAEVVKTISEENATPLTENKQRFINAVVEKLGNEKLTIVSLRKIADESGLGNIKDTAIQEYTELAIIMKATTIVKQDISQEEKFRQIVELYQAQPTISMRSSERIDKQQYSTPIPLSFLAGEFINKINPKSVLEPSAGNGMMVFNVDEQVVIANEIDEVRLENLRDQGFKVTNQDGTLEFNIEPVDAVVTNPPFGKSEAREYEGYKIAGLDEQMTINALLNMKDNGRAAIIIGGHTKYKDNGTLAAEKAFINYLYDKYNVVDIINVDGSLYRKQGTSFPVRMILINGRRTGFESLARKYAPLQKDARSEQVSTFEELFNRIQENENNLLRKGESIRVDNGTQPATESDRGDVQGVSARPNRQGSTSQREPGTSSVRPSQNGGLSNTTGLSSVDDAGRPNMEDNALDRGDDDGANNRPGSNRGVQRKDVSEFLNGSNARPEPLKIDLSKEKTPYPSRSKSEEIGSVVPTNVAQTINDILHKFKDIDSYVQYKLGYQSKEELFGALSAEQIDSVALAIYQIENNRALIIGDMTGVGKGRQAAAIIRYAALHGHKPVFITEKAHLFSDIYRDLRDIGSADLRPFIFNAKSVDADPSMTDENGVVVYKVLSPKVRNAVLAGQSLPDEYDYAVLSYSQLSGNTEKNGLSAKQSFLTNIARDNVLILDESHNAGGDGNTGTFLTELLQGTKGVVFLSGTFAKRADNMPIYAIKTSMSDANMSDTELIEAIKKGGVPLQEIMSKNLTETGQMVRRERDFSGVTIDWQTMTEAKEQHFKTFDGVIEVFNELIEFQKEYVDPVIEAINTDLADEQGGAEARQGTANLGISNVPFASKTFNLVRQLLFSLKAKEVAVEAIKELQKGNKPVIAVGNTMEAFLNDMGQVGDVVQKHDYSLTLLRGLTGLFRITRVDANNERHHEEIGLDAIGEAGRRRYAELEDKINKLSSGISISPIDVIKKEITDAGYSIGELTGRSNEIVFNEDGTAVISKRTNTDKKKLARDFNSGELDALVLNQSASTGISLHASSKFRDQRQRVMLFAQNQLDVNTEVQMRGRIDRTGQVQRGAYRYIISAIPAEQRMIMMFKAKLKSLDANTTSSQKSKVNEIEVVDFLNKYGDEIAIEYLKENPEINIKMLDPYGISEMDDTELARFTKADGAASKVAGRAALLSVKEQEAFYSEMTEKYTTLINYLNDSGTNDLEITTLPLNAETTAKHIVIQGSNNGNPFSEDSIRETTEVDVLKKPMSMAEINEEAQKLTGGLNPTEYRDMMVEKIRTHLTEQTNKETDKIRNDYAKREQAHFDKINKQIDRDIKRGEAQESDRNEILSSKRELWDGSMQLAIENKTNAIRTRYESVIQIIRSLPTGRVVLIPSTLEIDATTTYSEGMFLGFRMKDKITPSTITAVFAPLDSRRRIDVPLSKVPFLQAVYAQTMQGQRGIRANKDNWDSLVPTRTRRTAYIISGNILQAYGRPELRGQLVTYTTKEGAVRQGILLPERYRHDEQTMRVQIIKKIDALRAGEDLSDQSNGVTVKKESPTSYSITVPLSRIRGGKYFLDAGLRELVYQNDFRQMAGQMVGVVSEANIERALQYLSDKFNISVNDKMKEAKEEAAFKIVGENLPATININGVERPTTNSEGKQISSTEEGVRNFYKWFGDSKVVDAKGRPLVYWHGSSLRFTEFDKKRLLSGEGANGYGAGFYFTPIKSTAINYAERAVTNNLINRNNTNGVNVYPVYLRISNPLNWELNITPEQRKLVKDKWKLNLPDNITGKKLYTTLSSKYGDIKASQYLESIGIDGVLHTTKEKIIGGFGTKIQGDAFQHKGERHLIAFSPSQIKSATGNTGKFSSDTDDIRFKISPYYSPAERALESLRQEKGTPEQMKAMLLKNGAKEAEFDWMGWDEFVSGKKSVSKADIQDWIDQNRIEVQEVEKGSIERQLEWGSARQGGRPEIIVYDGINGNNLDIIHRTDSGYISIENQDGEEVYADDYETVEEAMASANGQGRKFAGDTKFAEYTLPGGKNYKELLLTMPEKREPLGWRIVTKEQNGRIIKSDAPFRTKQEAEEQLQIIKDAVIKGTEVYLEEDKTSTGKSKDNFQSSHYDEPNILAHVRFNEREVNGERVLFLEEIQSDWAQKGKKEGFKPKDEALIEKRLTEITNELRSKYFASGVNTFESEADARVYYNNWNSNNDAYGNDIKYGDIEFKDGQILDLKNNRQPISFNSKGFTAWIKENEPELYNEQERLYDLRENGTPSMPFKKTDQWVNLTLRRMMQYAAQNGFDRVAWTNGEQQAGRYDLSKQVSKIQYWKSSDEGYTGLSIYDKRGSVVMGYDASDFRNNELEGIVGKEIATKILNDDYSKGEEVRTIEGDNLKVGGEGMKAFYDKIVPAQAGKIVKPFGVKVESIDIKTLDTSNTKVETTEKGNYRLVDDKGNTLSSMTKETGDGFSKADLHSELVYLAKRYPTMNATAMVQSIPVNQEMRDALAVGIPYYKLIGEKGAINLDKEMERGAELFDIDGQTTFYHASSSKINGRLKPNQAKQFGVGVYLSTNKQLIADEFGDNITEVQLSITNPVYTNTPEWTKVTNKALQLANEGKPIDEDGVIIDEDTDYYEINSKFISNAAKELGHDAIIDLGSNDYDNEIAVLDETKIVYEGDKQQSTGISLEHAQWLSDALSGAFNIRVPGTDEITPTIIVRDSKEFIEHLPQFEEQALAFEVLGVNTGDKVYINMEYAESEQAFISTWIHEHLHQVSVDNFEKEYLAATYSALPNKTKALLGREAYKQADHIKLMELISLSAEKLYENYGLENLMNGNFDLSLIPESLREIVGTHLNIITYGNYQNNRQGQLDDGSNDQGAGQSLQGAAENTGYKPDGGIRNTETSEQDSAAFRLKKHQDAQQTQINWDAEDLFERNEAIASDPTTSELQREAGYDPNPDSGITFVEKQITDLGQITFLGEQITGPAKITSSNDIAFLFKNLETAESEHAFFVFTTDNGYKVLYLSTGTSTGTMIPVEKLAAAAKEFKATGVAMVHNHPSGILKASDADISITKRVRSLAEELGIDFIDSVIINTDSGQYASISYDDTLVYDKHEISGSAPVSIYQFDRNILHTPTSERAKFNSPQDVAEFLSRQKRGSLAKIHAIITDNQNRVTRYALLDGSLSAKEISKELHELVSRHGNTVFLASNGALSTQDANDIKGSLAKANIRLLDVLTIKQETDIVNNYRSFSDDGLLEPAGIYNNSVSEPSPLRDEVDATMRKALLKIGNRQLGEGFRFKVQESWQDSHIAVKHFLDVLRTNGVDIEEFNDYYLQVTQVPGRTDAQINNYESQFHAPLMAAIGEIQKEGLSYRDVENYAIMKHGIERNEFMRKQEAKIFAEKKIKKPTPKEQALDIDGAVMDEYRAALNEAYESKLMSLSDKDYSGVTAVKEEVGMTAEEYVEHIEGRISKQAIDNFWTAVNNTTNNSLDQAFKGGTMTKTVYNDLKGRYSYYIPLRGFDDEIAEDRYDYTPDMGTYYSLPMISAKGRRSRSETPFAYIWQMNQSAITFANRNILNQTIKRLSAKNTKGLLTAKKAWYIFLGEVDGVKQWELREPEYSPDWEQYQKNIEAFEDEMKELEEKGFAAQRSGRLNVGLFIKPKQAEQHSVHVMQNGVEYVIYFNADPAVARAINGANRTIVTPGKVQKWIRNATRTMAANFTTRNPAFILANFSRDFLYAASTLPAKESAAYAAKFMRNIPLIAASLKRAIRNKPDLNSKYDKYAVEYIMNGGKTGYSVIVELQKTQKRIERDLRRHGKKSRAEALLKGIQSANEFAENITRLAAYVTSREEGRSIVQSISDAKELTVNFNRNGSGGYGASFIKAYFLFVNAGVQALANFYKISKEHKMATLAIVGAYMISGVIQPLLLALLGDDDDLEKYMKLSDWERQNNICIPTGSGFVKIPLPHELRVFHGLGDNIFQAIYGYKEPQQAIADSMMAFADLLPISPSGAIDASWSELLPDIIKPVAQIYFTNTNFMGGRIIDEYKTKSNVLPGYRKARTNKKGDILAPSFAYIIAKGADDVTGGDGTQKGLVSPNPDVLHHLMRGYFGGIYTLAAQMGGVVASTYDFSQTGELKLKVKDTPLKSFYSSEDELNERNSALNAKYYQIYNKSREVLEAGKDYIKRAESGDLEITELYKKLEEIDYYRYKDIDDEFIKPIKKIEGQLNDIPEDLIKDAESIIKLTKEDLVNFYHDGTTK